MIKKWISVIMIVGMVVAIGFSQGNRNPIFNGEIISVNGAALDNVGGINFHPLRVGIGTNNVASVPGDDAMELILDGSTTAEVTNFSGMVANSWYALTATGADVTLTPDGTDLKTMSGLSVLVSTNANMAPVRMYAVDSDTAVIYDKESRESSLSYPVTLNASGSIDLSDAYSPYILITSSNDTNQVTGVSGLVDGMWYTFRTAGEDTVLATNGLTISDGSNHTLDVDTPNQAAHVYATSATNALVVAPN